jgi:hypothetical protein
MTRLAFAVLVSAVGGTAWGQYPQPGGAPQPPSFGGRLQQSPISPYLNLLNNSGANPAANYYNFARPLVQQQQGMSPFAPQGGQSSGGFQQQTGYLPPAALPARELASPFEPTGSLSLPPTGHPVVFGNKSGSGAGRTGYFPPASGQQPAATSKSIPRAKQ